MWLGRGHHGHRGLQSYRPGFFRLLAGPTQSVPRSELAGVDWLLGRVKGKTPTVIDASYVYKGLAKGNEATHRAHQDLWASAWANEGEGATPEPIPTNSHKKARQGVLEGRIDIATFLVNEWADKCANKGAEAAKLQPAYVAKVQKAAGLAWRVQSRLVEITILVAEAGAKRKDFPKMLLKERIAATTFVECAKLGGRDTIPK